LWTDPIDIRLSGFPASSDVTLTARYTGWGSSAVFHADGNGAIDLAVSAPSSGSYSGVDREGIVWSMTQSKSDTDTGADPYALRVTASVGDNQVASATLTRLVTTKDVTCAPVSDNGLVGYYCAKQGAPAIGGIVTFGGSEGGLGSGQGLAEYYASLGYPSLGLAYFGATGVPKELSEIPLEYFQTAFTWLAAKPEVNPEKIAVIGGSRGGELALLLGATFPQVTAVVAVVPSGVSWGAPDATGTQEVASWTYQGQPFAWIPYSATPEAKVTEPDGVVAYSDTPVFQAAMSAATSDQIAQASSKVENTNGPIMMIAAADDQIWPSCDLAKISMDRLMSSGHQAKYGDTLECYPDAGHNVTPFSLNVPTTSGMHSLTPEFGQILALGGTPSGIAHAARDSDDKTRAFLAKNLK
ncbi:MAG: acyl-CoA thioesterase/bile acid-CoA:amino acid N-acyltransferase family protein, partial [Polyangiaceae bacterium]